eukprot:180086_1
MGNFMKTKATKIKHQNIESNIKHQNVEPELVNVKKKEYSINYNENTKIKYSVNDINDPLTNKNKILLLGNGATGKTSIISTLFRYYSAKDCSRLGPTIKIAISSIQLFDNDLKLHFWDCGGCDKFMESYFNDDSHAVFSNVSILVYVFDISKPNEHAYQCEYFTKAVNCLNKHSSNAEIHCLFHKMDTINTKNRNYILNKYQTELNNIAKIFDANFKYFTTSIWNDSLHEWCSQMIHGFIFNPFTESIFKQKLKILCDKSLIDEIVLLESKTCLPFIQVNRLGNTNECNLKKVSAMIKKFNLKLYQRDPLGGKKYQSMCFSNKKFSVCVELVSARICVIFVVSNNLIEMEAVKINLNQYKHEYEELLHFCASGIITDTMFHFIITYWMRTFIDSSYVEKHLINMVALFFSINESAHKFIQS